MSQPSVSENGWKTMIVELCRLCSLATYVQFDTQIKIKEHVEDAISLIERIISEREQQAAEKAARAVISAVDIETRKIDLFDASPEVCEIVKNISFAVAGASAPFMSEKE